MIHLSPESGKWVNCPAGDDGKCSLRYHAPVGEGKVADSFLWEMYASEELYREPDIASVYRMWYNDAGQIHREYNLPAVEDPDGTKEWRKNGNLHRVDGPAIEWADGSTEWWIEGKRARTQD